MERGGAIIVGIFVFLVLVLAFSFYFYFAGEGNITGNVVSEEVIEDPADNIVAPAFLEVNAFIDGRGSTEFDVSNLNDRAVEMKCTFPSFQAYVTSSQCFTYDSNGMFVGQEAVSIPPRQTQVFTAVVTPQNGIKIKEGSSQIIIRVQEGEYSGEIELETSFEGEDKVSAIRIPVRIFVEE